MSIASDAAVGLQLRGDCGVAPGTAAGDENLRRVRARRASPGRRAGRASAACVAAGRRLAPGRAASAGTGWSRTAPGRGARPRRAPASATRWSANARWPAPPRGAATCARMLRRRRMASLVRGARGTWRARRARAAFSPSARAPRRARPPLRLGPDVLVEEALLREGAAQLERGRGERLAAQRRHLALEGLVGHERVLEEEQEQPSARARAREAQHRLGARLDIDLALGKKPLAVGREVRVPCREAHRRQHFGEDAAMRRGAADRSAPPRARPRARPADRRDRAASGRGCGARPRIAARARARVR